MAVAELLQVVKGEWFRSSSKMLFLHVIVHVDTTCSKLSGSETINISDCDGHGMPTDTYSEHKVALYCNCGELRIY